MPEGSGHGILAMLRGTPMTITERNQRNYELREQLIKARAQVAWIEQEIWLNNEKYKNQNLDLYTEMFGE